MAEAAFRSTLENDGPSFELSLTPEVVGRYCEHFELLVTWNRKLNLTRVIDPVEAARFHFLECAFVTTKTESPAADGGRVIDIGSGAGFPGIPMACLWPECEFVLVEPSGKRAVFLKEVIRKLGLAKVSVLNDRFSADHVRDTDMIATRALDGLDRELGSIVTSCSSTIALFTDSSMLEKAQILAPDRDVRAVEIPGTVNRRIGILSRSV